MSNSFFLAEVPACGFVFRTGAGVVYSGVSQYTEDIPMTGVAGILLTLLMTGTGCACCCMLGMALLPGTVLASLLAAVGCGGGSSQLGSTTAYASENVGGLIVVAMRGRNVNELCLFSFLSGQPVILAIAALVAL